MMGRNGGPGPRLVPPDDSVYCRAALALGVGMVGKFAHQVLA